MKSNPIPRRKDPELRPWPELRGQEPIYYHDDTVQPPMFTSINVNKDDYDYSKSNIQLTRTSSDGRTKHYKYNGSRAEAIIAALEAEGRL